MFTAWLLVSDTLLMDPVTSRLPNVIILVMDTVRASATSLGNPKRNTPTLARLAHRGVVFKNAYSTYDSTPKSHFSLLTGLKKGFHTKIDRSDQSVAHHLRQIGYEGLGVSANYNVRKAAIRATRPFKQFISPVGAYLKKKHPGAYNEANARADRLIRAFGAPRSSFNQNINRCGAPSVNIAMDALLQKTRKPALIFANYMDAHDPYFPPKPYYKKEKGLPKGFAGDVRDRPLPPSMTDPKSHIRDKKERRRFLYRLKTVSKRAWSLTDDLSKAHLAVYEKRYLEEVAYLDHQLEKTIEILDRHGFLKNSLLIVTADHGESFGEKGYITHSMGNRGDKETTRHVPMVMVPYYAQYMHPKKVEKRASIADIPATIYALLGIDDTRFTEKHGKNYGNSLAEYLPQVGRRMDRQAELDVEAPNVDRAADEAEMMKSLKALGYIVD